MNIGDVAERTGLPAKTIRYYEEIGLIAPDRDANGYRRFDASHAAQAGLSGPRAVARLSRSRIAARFSRSGRIAGAPRRT
jgi:predicted site-specific integrase-resolvase